MHFLRFNSKDHFEEVFEQFMLHDGNSKTVPAYIGKSTVDVIGTIFKPKGEYILNSDGEFYPEYKQIEGWHVNFSHEVPEELSAYLIGPPVRVFLGD